MEETNSTAAPANNRMVMILLGVIVILLAAIVAFVVLGGDDKTADTPGGETTTTAGTPTPPAGMGGQEQAFDPAAATVVAEGKTPEQHVTAYFDAVVAGDFAGAYKMLPTAKQAEYGSVDAFSQQLTGYGINSYSIDGATETGDEAKVTATAVMEGGNFQYEWTFVKDGGKWLVKSRTLPGMN